MMWQFSVFHLPQVSRLFTLRDGAVRLCIGICCGQFELAPAVSVVKLALVTTQVFVADPCLTSHPFNVASVHEPIEQQQEWLWKGVLLVSTQHVILSSWPLTPSLIVLHYGKHLHRTKLSCILCSSDNSIHIPPSQFLPSIFQLCFFKFLSIQAKTIDNSQSIQKITFWPSLLSDNKNHMLCDLSHLARQEDPSL